MSEEEDENYTESEKNRAFDTASVNTASMVNDAKAFDSLVEDVIGNESSDSDEEDFSERKKGKPKSYSRLPNDTEKIPDYMFFDFRKGPESFPKNCLIIDPARAEVLLQRQVLALKLFKT